MTTQTNQDRHNIKTVTTDAQLEEGVFPVNELVHIITATYAWRGLLVAVTPSFYVLENAALVYETGDSATYRKSKKGTSEDVMTGRTLVERTACIAHYPLGKL